MAIKSQATNHVYLLVEKGDEWDVIGVYSTREKAEKAKSSRPCDRVPIVIQEQTLDAKPEYSACVGHK